MCVKCARVCGVTPLTVCSVHMWGVDTSTVCVTCMCGGDSPMYVTCTCEVTPPTMCVKCARVCGVTPLTVCIACACV